MRGEVRVGRVSSVGAKAHTVRVTFSDVPSTDPDLVSYDLNVMATRPGDYALPPTDTAVLCLLLDGNGGVGYVLGILYSDADAPPLDDAGKRAIASDDLRLGAPDATDKVALAPKVKQGASDLHDHLQAIEQVISGPPIAEPGNGSPSAFQTALAAALMAKPLPAVTDPAAEKVSAK